jgi:hypothetical protein
MAAGFVIHHRLKDRVKDGHSGYPLTRATPLSEQRSVLFPQLLEPRFHQTPQFGTTASLVHSVGPRAPARQMVVRITLCACLEGREGTGYQPNCVLICPLQLPPPPPVRATVGVVSVKFWDFSVALTQGGGVPAPTRCGNATDASDWEWTTVQQCV